METVLQGGQAIKDPFSEKGDAIRSWYEARRLRQQVHHHCQATSAEWSALGSTLHGPGVTEILGTGREAEHITVRELAEHGARWREKALRCSAP